MSAKTVLILGAGIGGLVAARELRRRLDAQHRVVLVDRESEHRFQSSFLWVMMGWREPAAITRSLLTLPDRGIDFRRATVQAIDPASQTVDTDAGTLDYDYLVVALGAQLNDERFPGLALAGATPYSLDGATQLRHDWQHLDRGSVALVIADLPFKCPAAPYEAALLLDHGFRKRGVRSQIRIDLFTPEPQPMPVAGPAVGDALRDILQQRDIGFSPQRRLTAVDSERRRLIFDGDESGFDLLVYVPSHQPPAPIRDSKLAGESGWIPVDPHSLGTSWQTVYAIGDSAAVPLANGMMLPKAGVFAHGEALVVAKRIAAQISGHNGVAPFDGWGGCFVETGGGKAAYGSGNFLADPAPRISLESPARSWRLAKVAFEKAWLAAIGGPAPASALAWRALDWGPAILERRWLWRWR